MIIPKNRDSHFSSYASLDSELSESDSELIDRHKLGIPRIFILIPKSEHELALLLNPLVMNWSKYDFKLKIVQFFIWYL